MSLSVIVAVDLDMGISKNGHIPWHLQNDLLYFKRLTLNHDIIMGRKTFESIGKRLPNRHNIIFSRDNMYDAEGCTVLNDIKSIGFLNYMSERFGSEMFVIGGKEIISQAMRYVDKIYLTRVEDRFRCDTFLDCIDFTQWDKTIDLEGIVNERNTHPHRFEVYEKNIEK